MKNYQSYQGKIQACILDWSGTVADAYVLAPAVVFVKVFEKYGVPISMKEARKPMGIRKDLHIKEITEIPKVRERWKEKHGKYPEQSDINAMYHDAIPMQLECLHEYTELIPGTAETIKKIRQDYGVKIGCTTGFIRSMVEILEEAAEKQGYIPDASVAGDDVINGTRPKPFMLYRNLELMDVYPIQAVIKVDDTVSGIGEALSAGCWAVGVARYSNYMDINSMEEAQAMSDEEIQIRLKKTRQILLDSGADYVIDSITDLPFIINVINKRLQGSEALDKVG